MRAIDPNYALLICLLVSVFCIPVQYLRNPFRGTNFRGSPVNLTSNSRSEMYEGVVFKCRVLRGRNGNALKSAPRGKGSSFPSKGAGGSPATRDRPAPSRAASQLSASATAYTPTVPSPYKEALQRSSSMDGASSKGKQSSSQATPTHNSFATLDTDRVDVLNEGCFLMRQDSRSSSLVREVEARYRDDKTSSGSSLDSFPVALSSAQKKKLKLQKAKMREDEIQRVIAFASGTPMPDESVDTMDLSLAEFSKKILKPSKLKIKKPPVRIR